MCNPAFFLRNSVRVPIVPLSFFPSFLYSSEGDGAPPQKIRWHNACVSPPLPALSMDVCMWHMRNLSGSSSQSNHLPQSHDWLIEDKNETIVVRDRHILLWGQFMSSECSGEASESQRYCVTLETTQREWKIVKSNRIGGSDHGRFGWAEGEPMISWLILRIYTSQIVRIHWMKWSWRWRMELLFSAMQSDCV